MAVSLYHHSDFIAWNMGAWLFIFCQSKTKQSVPANVGAFFSLQNILGILFSADGEKGELQLENLVAVFVFFGDECDFFAESVNALNDAFVAFLADSERKARNMAAAGRIAVDGIGGEF